MTADAERLAAIRARTWLAKWDKAEWKPSVQFGGDVVRGLLNAYETVAAERDAEKERANRLKACVEADDALLGAVIEAMGSRLDRDPVIAARELVAERDALRARIAAATAEARELARQGYPMGVMLRVLAGDQPEAEGSDLPNGHAPVEELSPFLHRRIQPEAAPLNSCGRGICALNDGHSGRCTT